MVPIDNLYQIRSLFLSAAIDASDGDVLKQSILHYLSLSEKPYITQDNQPYVNCALSGFELIHPKKEDLLRLLGRSSFLDSTPMPWVTDLWSVLGVKFAVQALEENEINIKFNDWVKQFLPDHLLRGSLTTQEIALANYILDNDLSSGSDACMNLFFHYKKKTHLSKLVLETSIEVFFNDFKSAYKNTALTPLFKAIYVYVFDQINESMASVSPRLWSKEDVIVFLENLSIGLKRWTWEEAGRTKNSDGVKWDICNEYHVQNLLYVLLAPIFNDIEDEVYTEQIGQKTARIDLRIPSINLIIEVKYRKDKNKSFQALIGEMAEDRSLYRADSRFRNNTFICFLWDNTLSTQEHAKFKEGVLKIEGIDGCVVINAPSFMRQRG